MSNEIVWRHKRFAHLAPPEFGKTVLRTGREAYAAVTDIGASGFVRRTDRRAVEESAEWRMGGRRWLRS
jgi:hypothetical protein